MRITVLARHFTVCLLTLGMTYLVPEGIACKDTFAQKGSNCDQKAIQQAERDYKRCYQEYKDFNARIDEKNAEADEAFKQGDEAFRKTMSLPEAGSELGKESTFLLVEKTAERYGSEHLAENLGTILTGAGLLKLVYDLGSMVSKETSALNKGSVIAGQLSQLNAEALNALHCAVEAKERRKKLEDACKVGNSFLGQSQGNPTGEKKDEANLGDRAKSWEAARQNLFLASADLGRAQDSLAGATSVLQSLQHTSDTSGNKLTNLQLMQFKKPMAAAFEQLQNCVGHYNKAQAAIKNAGGTTGKAAKKKS